LLVKVITYLLSMFILKSCSPGWRIAGYELNQSEEEINTVFIEIVAHDSTMHWYAGNLFHGENYCILHNKWEDVRIK